MRDIKFSMKIEPATKGNSVMVLQVEEKREGPFAASCDKCDTHFVGIIKENSKYTTLVEFIGIGAKDAMNQSRIERPLVGTVVLEIVVQHRRPQDHYAADGSLSKLEARPHCWPSVHLVTPAIVEGLEGVAFKKSEQINGLILKKEYGEEHAISVSVIPVSAFDIDKRVQQPNLFELEFLDA